MSWSPAALCLVLLSVHILLITGIQVLGPDPVGLPGPPGISEGRVGASLCQCPLKAARVSRRQIKDFSIEMWKPTCGTEIILTLEEYKVCLEPDKRQGKQLLRCWMRIQSNSHNQRMKCLNPSGKK